MFKAILCVIAILTMVVSPTHVSAQKSGKSASLSGCLVAYESSGKYPLGSIENTCAFPINFVYCLENIRDGVTTVKGCNSRPYEIVSIPSRGTFGSETDRGDAYYFACMSPGVPTKVDYVKNQGIRAACTNEEESTAKKREATPSDKSIRTQIAGNQADPRSLHTRSTTCAVNERLLRDAYEARQKCAGCVGLTLDELSRSAVLRVVRSWEEQVSDTKKYLLDNQTELASIKEDRNYPGRAEMNRKNIQSRIAENKLALEFAECSAAIPNSNSKQVSGDRCKPNEEIVRGMIREDIPMQISTGSKSPEADSRKMIQSQFDVLNGQIERGDTSKELIASAKYYEWNEFGRLRSRAFVEVIECHLRNGTLKR